MASMRGAAAAALVPSPRPKTAVEFAEGPDETEIALEKVRAEAAAARAEANEAKEVREDHGADSSQLSLRLLLR